jgi:hypothetical protein
MLSDEGVPYYRERYGKPLLIKLWDGWTVCSKDGEPSHLIDPKYKIEIYGK